MTKDSLLAYISGYLRGTYSSIKNYSMEELLERMKYLSDLIDKNYVVSSAEEIIQQENLNG
jgi:hypothetical protein